MVSWWHGCIHRPYTKYDMKAGAIRMKGQALQGPRELAEVIRGVGVEGKGEGGGVVLQIPRRRTDSDDQDPREIPR